MTYLIAEMFLMLAVAAVLGFLLGCWWVRRQFKDVTEEYSRLLTAGPMRDYTPTLDGLAREVKDHREEVTGLIRSIEGRLRDLVAAEVSRIRGTPASDFGPIEKKLEQLKTAIQQNGETTDAEPLQARLHGMEEALRALPPPSAPIDMSSLERALDHLSPLKDRLDALDGALRDLRWPEPPALDLSPIQARITELDARIAGLSTQDLPPPVDIEPVKERLSRVEDALRALRLTEPQSVDLHPLQLQLTQFEQWVKAQLERPAPPAAPPGPVMLKSATYGPKDDLKKISGVGPVLERLLNELGVYYFFQIASWSPADVQVVDTRLEAFKGRIERDHWVQQSKSLAAQSRAKPPPGLVDASFGLAPGEKYPTDPKAQGA